MSSKQLLGFEVTQRVFIEQTLERLYHGAKTSLAYKLQRSSGQLMPLYLHRLLGSLKRLSIVEVNCGYGFLSNYLSLLLPETSVVGIEADVRQAACAHGSIGNRQNLSFIANEFSKVPKIEADLIILNIAQWDNEAALLIERAYQWLIPGGDLVIRTGHPKTHWQNYFKLLSPDFLGRWARKDPWLETAFLDKQTTSSWQKRLESSGFSCLAEYDATSACQSSLERVLSYFSGNTLYHAEKPLFTAKAPAFSPPVVTAVKPVVEGIKADPLAPPPAKMPERQTASIQQAAIKKQLRQAPAASPYELQPQEKRHVATSVREQDAEDALSYIFSRPWTSLSQEISAS
ncbi:MAG: hypothetical protein VKJ04_07710 [Vampirovibrionales bacterium]|nr:hypothetical protein [Vampirovibrionales bacterium]